MMYLGRFRKDPLYKQLREKFGGKSFHLYQIVSENATIKEITGIKARIRELVINGACRSLKKKPVRIRGKIHELRYYELC